MKKTLSIALALSMAVGLMAFSASAAPTSDLSKMTVEQVAYLDIDSASPKTREAILAARDQIIHGEQAWTVNGAVSVFNRSTGEVETLPEFSDLFPGWDIPTVESHTVEYGIPDAVAQASGIDYIKTQFLGLADGYEASPEFTTFNGNGKEIGVAATKEPCAGTRYNLGASCDGNELGWIPDLTVNDGIKFTAELNRPHAIRGSVFRSEYAGYYRIRVSDDPGFLGTFESLD